MATLRRPFDLKERRGRIRPASPPNPVARPLFSPPRSAALRLAMNHSESSAEGRSTSTPRSAFRASWRKPSDRRPCPAF
jgi:hypothetical protein